MPRHGMIVGGYMYCLLTVILLPIALVRHEYSAILKNNNYGKK